MDAPTLLDALARVGTPARAAHAAGYTPSALRFLGVAVPDLRRVLRPTLVEARTWPTDRTLALVAALHRSGVFEGRAAAYELLEALPKARRALGEADLAALAEGNDNWASVDAYACGVAGPAWRLGQLGDTRVLAWAASPDRWLRRTALVCTVALNLKSRGGTGDTPRTLDICARLATDRDEMVVKALSWALREVGERDPAAVIAFLERHPVAARVRREVETKLRTGTKRGA